MTGGDFHEDLGGADPAYEPWQAAAWRWIELVGGILFVVGGAALIMGCVSGQLKGREAGRAMCYPLFMIPFGLGLIGHAWKRFRDRRRQLDEALNLQHGHRPPDRTDDGAL